MSSSKVPGILKLSKFTFWLILILAAVLRFYHYDQIPFTHDEFSALFRTQYDSAAEVLRFGVMEGDTHPAGIQLFLYYWTQLVGWNEVGVKLPFTLMGLGAMIYAYWIAKKWFNETVALLVLAQLASMQYLILYSQIARPYVSGFFFSMAMVYYWTSLMQNPQNKFWKNGALFTLFACACAYNHHFSLLFAGIVGITGIIFIPATHRKKYLILGAIAIAGYLPHLPIFLAQLSQGGIEGWLSKPRSDFYWQYIRYVHHFSPLSFGISFILFLLSFYLPDVTNRSKLKWRLALPWALLPFLIGFFYSTYLSAVLQYSMLIFCFPFLLLFFYGGLKPLKPVINLILVLLILGVNTYTLVAKRAHYQVFYNSVFEGIAVDLIKSRSVLNLEDKDCFPVLAGDREKISYYFPVVPNDILWHGDSISEIEFLNQLKQSQKPYCYLGFISEESANLVPLIQQFYPQIIRENKYQGGMTYLFAKADTAAYDGIWDFEKRSTNWAHLDEKRLISNPFDSSEQVYDFRGHEWGPAIEIPLDSIAKHENDYLDFEAHLETSDTHLKTLFVAVLSKDDSTYLWEGKQASLYRIDPKKITLPIVLKLADYQGPIDKVKLSLYLWNEGKNDVVLEKVTFRRRAGSPILYGLTEEIKHEEQ